MVEASNPDSAGEEYESRGDDKGRDSLMVTDARVFDEQAETADLFTEESCIGFTVRNP